MRSPAVLCRLSLPLVVACSGCQLLEVADKIHKATHAGNDETLVLAGPSMVAEGARFEVFARDGCTAREDRCEVDSIKVKDVHAGGPFDVVDFEDDVVTLRAAGSGGGFIDVTVTMDGERRMDSIEVSAAEVTAMTLMPDCVGAPSRWVAAGARLGVEYDLLGAGESLEGSLAPPLDTTLVVLNLDKPGHVVYQVPDEPGTIAAISRLDDREALGLEAYTPEQVLPELTPRSNLRGQTVYFWVEQRVEGSRPCVEERRDVRIRSQSPDVCLLSGGGTQSEERVERTGGSMHVDVLRSGTCVLAARFEDGTEEIVHEFELVR